MEWDKKTKEDDTKQSTGFSIDAGDVGYLRASIGMQRENAVLRMLFAPKYWEEESKDEYDFKDSYEMLGQIGLKYLLAVLTGKEVEVLDTQKENMEQQKALGVMASNMFREAFGNDKRVKVCESTIDDFKDAVMWLNSLFAFFDLGIQKQEQGLKPYPNISW